MQQTSTLSDLSEYLPIKCTIFAKEINMLKNIFFILVLCLSVSLAWSQEDTTIKIPIDREYFHDLVIKEQKAIDRADGKLDGSFRLGSNENVHLQLTDALYRRVNNIRYWVEGSLDLPTRNDKVTYLRYIENMLRNFRSAWKNKDINPLAFPLLVENFYEALQLQAKDSSLSGLLKSTDYGVAQIITDVLRDNPGIAEMRNITYRKFCALYPDKILSTIRPYINQPFADSLLILAAKNNPVQIYSYAQSSSSPEGKLIHRSSNGLVKIIAQLSHTPNALLYFPFLDDLLAGRKNIAEIKKYVGDGEKEYDSVGYYKLLVKTEIEYFKRMAPPARDTPIAMFGANGLQETLQQKAIQHFITPINTLHDQSNINIRMRAIDPLSPEDIYFMMVMGENEIYTSSYKHSFNRMLQRMGPKPRTDSLLLNVNFDYFKKFIKMAANYNKLDTFLKLMPTASSEVLMKAFVANLDQQKSLEDAVDVADSYSSITDPKLLQTILNYVKQNEENAAAVGNTKGAVIYGLLKTIFISSNDNSLDLTKELGIPPIYEVPMQLMKDEKGRIVQQVFFYGDEDGKTFFPPFVNSFSAKDWIRTDKKEWVELKSRKGEVYVFANRPLNYDANLDDSAQVHLAKYLEANDMSPTMAVHRGHSYWLKGTISRLPETAHIILLGSCGGYQNLNSILEICPDAHIISTKEIGKGDVNQPIINYLNQVFVSGDTLVWKKMWANLTKFFKNDPNPEVRESWDDYIPPYHNLGAIFLKAYHKKMEDN